MYSKFYVGTYLTLVEYCKLAPDGWDNGLDALVARREPPTKAARI